MLTPYWFRTSKGLGFGVTAFSEEDAWRLLREARCLGEEETVVEIVAGIQHFQLDQKHVVSNAGPMLIRGVWYPNLNLRD